METWNMMKIREFSLSCVGIFGWNQVLLNATKEQNLNKLLQPEMYITCSFCVKFMHQKARLCSQLEPSRLKTFLCSWLLSSPPLNPAVSALSRRDCSQKDNNNSSFIQHHPKEREITTRMCLCASQWMRPRALITPHPLAAGEEGKKRTLWHNPVSLCNSC